jgi:hypothetical protein
MLHKQCFIQRGGRKYFVPPSRFRKTTLFSSKTLHSPSPGISFAPSEEKSWIKHCSQETAFVDSINNLQTIFFCCVVVVPSTEGRVIWKKTKIRLFEGVGVSSERHTDTLTHTFKMVFFYEDLSLIYLHFLTRLWSTFIRRILVKAWGHLDVMLSQYSC